ncbi:hypothetical protein GCM10010472_31450 [Pseudonocardia halophobica]
MRPAVGPQDRAGRGHRGGRERRELRGRGDAAGRDLRRSELLRGLGRSARAPGDDQQEQDNDYADSANRHANSQVIPDPHTG